MDFTRPLIRATLLRRYKRFLADVKLQDGSEVTAHCANPGSMRGLAGAGATVWLEPNDDPKRKLRYSWKLVQSGAALVCVDTGFANKVVAEALAAGGIAPLAPYTRIRPEVRYGENSRIDFLLQDKGLPDCYVEVKSVTLAPEPPLAAFPDSVTKRGARHLVEMARMVDEGHRAVMLYLVQRNDCNRVTLAADIDPGYVAAFRAAQAAGVEVLALGTRIDRKGITAAGLVPFVPPDSP